MSLILKMVWKISFAHFGGKLLRRPGNEKGKLKMGSKTPGA